MYKAAKEFPNRGLEHVWDRVIALGMERFCKQCSNARNTAAGAAGAAPGIRSKAHGVIGKAHGVEGGRPSQEDAEVECVSCRQKLPCEAFDAARLRGEAAVILLGMRNATLAGRRPPKRTQQWSVWAVAKNYRAKHLMPSACVCGEGTGISANKRNATLVGPSFRNV